MDGAVPRGVGELPVGFGCGDCGGESHFVEADLAGTERSSQHWQVHRPVSHLVVRPGGRGRQTEPTDLPIARGWCAVFAEELAPVHLSLKLHDGPVGDGPEPMPRIKVLAEARARHPGNRLQLQRCALALRQDCLQSLWNRIDHACRHSEGERSPRANKCAQDRFCPKRPPGEGGCPLGITPPKPSSPGPACRPIVQPR